MDEQYQTVPVRLTEKTPGVFRADYTPCTGGKHTVQVRHCTPTTPPAPAANTRSRYDTVRRLHPLHRRQTYGPGTTLYADYTPCTGGKHTVQVRHYTPTTPPAPAANIRSRYADYTPSTGGKHTVQVRHCTPTTPPPTAANIRSRYDTVRRLYPSTGGKHTVQVRHCTPTTPPAPAANIPSRYDTVRRLHSLHRRQTYGPGTTLYADYTPCTGGKHTVQVRHCTPTTLPAPAANIRSRYDTVRRLHPLHRRQTYGPGKIRYTDYTPCTGGKHTVQVRHCTPTTPPAPAANIRSRYDTVRRLHPLHRRQTHGPGTTLYADYTPCTGGKHTVQVRHCPTVRIIVPKDAAQIFDYPVVLPLSPHMQHFAEYIDMVTDG